MKDEELDYLLQLNLVLEAKKILGPEFEFEIENNLKEEEELDSLLQLNLELEAKKILGPEFEIKNRDNPEKDEIDGETVDENPEQFEIDDDSNEIESIAKK